MNIIKSLTIGLSLSLVACGIFFQQPASAASDYPVNVYRFWSQNFNNAHFYTTDYNESMNIIMNDDNWTYEGVDFGAYENDIAGCESHSEVYRFWSSNFRTHFFTMSVAEKNHLISNDKNWWYEGVAYCADSTAVSPVGQQTYPLHRFWSPVYKNHFYTGIESEAQYIMTTNPNWQYEGIAYYVPRSF